MLSRNWNTSRDCALALLRKRHRNYVRHSRAHRLLVPVELNLAVDMIWLSPYTVFWSWMGIVLCREMEKASVMLYNVTFPKFRKDICSSNCP